jgi:hypothetical protein
MARSMNRRLRAWDNDEFKMILPSSVPFEIDYNLQEFCEIFLKGFSDRYIPMLSLLINDIHQNEIFECDIIRHKWKHEKDNWKISECPELSPEFFHWYAELEDMDIEKIGNKFENGDLLNKKC